MMPTFNPERFDAFARLLAQPDPRDLPRRAHTCRCEGDPDRRATRLPGILMGWLQRRHLAVDVEEPIAPATRTWTRRGRGTNPGLRVLRPTGSGRRPTIVTQGAAESSSEELRRFERGL